LIGLGLGRFEEAYILDLDDRKGEGSQSREEDKAAVARQGA